jgi:hypothetical protein
MADIREQAIEAAFEAMLRVDGRVSDNALAAVVDAVEPIIRADEQDEADHRLRMRIHEINDQVAEVKVAIEAEVRERLRAQVRALRDEYDESLYPYTHNALNRVLALLDGTS